MQINGLEPIAQPPGIATCASLLRAKRGPKTTIEARILSTSSSGAVVEIPLDVSTVKTSLFSSKVTSAFKALRTFAIVVTSESGGILDKEVFPSEANNVDAKIGNAAFLAPSILTDPFN